MWITNGTEVPFFTRKTFSVEKPVIQATARVSGMGQFNFFLNGEKVSDHILDPGWTDYDKAVQYVDFDVTERLRPETNACAIEVGNGWYILDQEHHYTFRFPPFMPPNPNPYHPYGPHLTAWMDLEIVYADGSSEHIVTDTSWKTAPHEVEYTNVYGSERINGGRRQKGFAETEFEDAGWTNALEAVPPKGALIPQTQPPIRVIREYPAKERGTVGEQRVYDLGQNISGLLKARVRGRKGTEIRFCPAEKLDADGRPDQMAKGWMPIDTVITYVIGEDDVWEDVQQTFTYFAGRYIGVEGEAEVKDLTGLAITSAWKQAGSFRSDDLRYDQIYDMIEKTVEANMLSVHTDCPTIERFAWQEPNHLMGAAILYMKDGKKLWEKFLADMRRAQHTAEDFFHDLEGLPFYPGDGLVPAQAPCYIPNVLPVPGMGSFYDIIPWGSSIILAARWHYLFYGDISIIRDNYAAGMRYLEHLKKKRNEEGFICHGLGDWGNPEGELARENIETAFLFADASTLAWFAGLLGKEDEQKALRAFADEVCKNYNAKLLVRNDKGQYCYRSYEHREQGIVMTQACEALPLYWGMVPKAQIADVQEALRETLDAKGALIAGEVGLPYVIQAASAAGLNDRIAAFIMNEKHPSYYAFILDGETTLGEYWENNPRSHCHDMMGHIIEWYYDGIAGIEIAEAGFRKVRIHPWMPDSMHSFTCSHETPFGTICVKGERHADGHPVYSFTIPEEIELIE